MNAAEIDPNRIEWNRGGNARVQHIEGDRIRLHSSVAFAPGAPPEGTLIGGARIRIKVSRCRRIQAPGESAEGQSPQTPMYEFEIEGRLIDANRELRAAIARLIPPTDKTG